MRRNGFTLLEVLVVIAILGILMGIVFSTLSASRARALVRDTAQKIGSDLSRARSSSQRRSQDSSLTLAGDGRSYTLSLSGTTTTQTLPDGITVQSIGSSPTVITYKAPFGELGSSSGSIWQVSRNNTSIYIKVIGVTGKVGVYAE